MSFGRQKNMVRRPHRPDHDFHRSKRRRGHGTRMEGAHGPSVLTRILNRIARMLSRR